MIGLPTGKASGVFVLDIDMDPPRVNGAEGLAELEERFGKLPDTLEARTPRGGWHLYFDWPEGLGNSRGILSPGMDVRGRVDTSSCRRAAGAMASGITGGTRRRCSRRLRLPSGF